MDIVERLRKSANTVYSQDGYTFRLGLQNEAANEIERLQEALRLIANHPVEQSGQWEVGAKEMQKIANSALKDPAALGYEIVKTVLKNHGLWEGDQ